MCGRFAQAQTREEYLAYLADEGDRDIAYDPEPIGRYNIAADGVVPADKFIWHAVTRAVGNVKNQGPDLIEPVT
ncbi:hypothetical protein ACQYE4_000727 [Enterobacter bugandensis]|nr:hypothetical protein [Enterobacter bugandensis]MCK6860942.1 hypothetical protein [Enterobacter bugandensis]